MGEYTTYRSNINFKTKEMKTLSIKQPWAYLLCSGIKSIENRTWKLPEKYKNEWVLIHASAAKMKSLQKMLTLEQRAIVDKKLGYEYDRDKVFAKSAIIGAVKFSDCVINHPSIWAEKVKLAYPCDNEDDYRDDNGKLDYETYRHDIREYFKQKPIYNWIVSDAILFDKPILNVKGKLSFWDFDLPDEYVELLK